MTGKGAAPTMQTILLMVIMLAILVVFLAAVTRTQNLNAITSLDEFGIMKLENAFSLANRSLGMTWYVFAVQSVFDATDSSVRCGLDDDVIAGGDIMPAGYWYYFDGLGGKDFTKSWEFVLDENGNPDKYSDVRPAICYPANGKENSAKGSATGIMEEKFLPLKEGVRQVSEANGITIVVSPLAASSRFFMGRNGLSQPVVARTDEQDVMITDGDGNRISDTTRNENTIYTEFPGMLDFSRSIVKNVFLHMSNPATSYVRYRDVTGEYDTSDKYRERMKGFISELVGLAESSAFGDNSKISVYEKYSAFELRSSDPNDGPLFGLANGAEADDIGLIFSYDAEVSMREKSGADAATCEQPPEEYVETIKAEFDSRKDEESGGWKFGGTDGTVISEEDVMAFVEGMIRQESGWNPEAVSCAGAAGLGQLMPDTAAGYGLYVPDYGAATYYCSGTRYARNVCNSLTPDECDRGSDERFDPEKNIRAAVSYVYDLLDAMSAYTSDREELLKLAAAAYNCGPGCVSRAVTDTGVGEDGVRFDDIASKLPAETQDYVPRVLGGFVCYGGTLAGGDLYYYHDEARNRFVKRPFSMSVKARDDIVAIDCYGSRSAIQFFSWQDQPKQDTVKPVMTGDTMCCGGKLWSCSAAIPGISHDVEEGGRVDSSADSGAICNSFVSSLAPAGSKEFWLQCDADGFRFYATYCSSYLARGECEANGCEWYTDTEAEYCSNPS